jgi:hypothetical protein
VSAPRVEQLAGARRRALVVARMRSLAGRGAAASSRSAAPPRTPPPAADAERCDICQAPLPEDHRHLLQLEERRIVCACEACWALHAGDAEYRPTGTRTVWLEPFDLDAELWARFQVPIGLAFFMRSTVSGGVVAFYPSPAGATESELDLEAWGELARRNPVLADLDPDGEALIVNRLSAPAQHAIAPIDECYRLVGLIKTRWEGISGGAAVTQAVDEFFAALRARSAGRRDGG